MEAELQKRLSEVFVSLYSAQNLEGVNEIETTDADEDGESYRILHIEDLDVYVKILFEENSYGEEEIMGITFVTPTKIEITEFKQA